VSTLPATGPTAPPQTTSPCVVWSGPGRSPPPASTVRPPCQRLWIWSTHCGACQPLHKVNQRTFRLLHDMMGLFPVSGPRRLRPTSYFSTLWVVGFKKCRSSRKGTDRSPRLASTSKWGQGGGLTRCWGGHDASRGPSCPRAARARHAATTRGAARATAAAAAHRIMPRASHRIAGRLRCGCYM
jgi:hypothetical protein